MIPEPTIPVLVEIGKLVGIAVVTTAIAVVTSLTIVYGIKAAIAKATGRDAAVED